ncbi:pyridoxamine 5'-phosphate oxidase [Algoriphagus machipongonensis]|uniref:Pyridoxine/pyridoxamine 5'-phosphate oxidase n=1 Tax=Algoriphagus machipongonensis TaxID=388413 RepID=A3HT40_9BACT|nr:pyridoxamine 5'-phosphate oxidase [Algoriphagus machipongonensis]EAZ83008.1 pyridoxamine 5'-phosphate oxidase [Algoriphagus machipongonensis]
MNISAIRKDYSLKTLEINTLKDNPIDQFQSWLQEAIIAEVAEVNAMTLSTLGLDGIPNGRIVLLKELDQGFVFFTNYKSEKGKEIAQTPKGSLTFFWIELERQVRIKGKIEKVSAELSDKYFFSRPVESQIGAWTSPQSQKIPSSEDLQNRKKEIEKKFEQTPLSRPPHWGGYRLIPSAVEFWQGRPSRLHDRVLYEKQNDGSWKKSILAP